MISFFIVPFTLVGLFGVKMLRNRFIAKYFRPFIDAIHGPYKDNFRYWFGVRLLVLSIIYITTAVLEGNNLTLQFLLIQIILGSFTIVQAVVLPYKKNIVNALDIWFMVLLLIYFSITLAYNSSENPTVSDTVMALEIVLCFITYLLIMMYHMYISMSHFRCIRLCYQILIKRTFKKLIKAIFPRDCSRFESSEDRPLLRHDDSFHYEEW